MPRTKISEYSTTNSDNTDIESINIAEGCAPSGINNAIRELMVHLKEFQTGASGDAFTFAGGTLMSGTNTISGAAVISGNINSSGTNTFSGSQIISGNFNATGTTNTFSNALILGNNLTFSGTGSRITGDFSNATIANRLAFQTSTTNGNSSVNVLPNGTGINSNFYAFNNSDPTNASYLRIAGGANSNLEARIESGITGTGTYLPMTFLTGGSERMRLDTSGNLGIGTSSPISKLSVLASGTAVTTVSSDAASNATIEGPNVAIASSFSSQLAILSNSSVAADTGGGIAFGGKYNGNAFAYYAAVKTGKDNATSGQFGGYLSFASRANGGDITERMRIASTGYVYVNTTDTASQDGYISIKSTSAAQQCIDSWNSATSGTRTHAKFRDSAGATVRGSITSDGANTAYVTSSDYRLKENIVPLANALSTIVQLKPSVWTWKENQEAGQGFIAHELAEVVPQAVTGEKDAVDADGKPQYQGVDTSFLVATLTAAIQELKAELDTANTRLAALENK